MEDELGLLALVTGGEVDAGESGLVVGLALGAGEAVLSVAHDPPAVAVAGAAGSSSIWSLG